MYRLLRSVDEVRKRRRLAIHPQVNPQLLTAGPNQPWSCDITKLLGPQQWTFFYIYVILDSSPPCGSLYFRNLVTRSCGFTPNCCNTSACCSWST